jgi:tetratricopeptide (TPR) repeat protein
MSARKAALQCGLGKALLDALRPFEAIDAFTTALHSEPNNINCLIDISWLRSAHQDPAIRQPRLAIESATRAVALSAGGVLEAPALDSLAAALASEGQFDRAVSAARRAILLTPDNAVRQAINERLSLYERRLPFRVTTR